MPDQRVCVGSVPNRRCERLSTKKEVSDALAREEDAGDTVERWDAMGTRGDGLGQWRGEQGPTDGIEG